jgi:hypothetical protein
MRAGVGAGSAGGCGRGQDSTHRRRSPCSTDGWGDVDGAVVRRRRVAVPLLVPSTTRSLGWVARRRRRRNWSNLL